MRNFPLYFFPATICFLDDNERFLKNNILGLDPKYRYYQHVEPEEAIEYLEQSNHTVLDENKLVEELHTTEEIDESAKKVALAVNLEPIAELSDHEARFKTTSVLVVDYAMPSMNGLEVCHKLADSPIKKIMITGQADHRLAVEAFNQGVIDYFVLKDEVDFYSILNTAIDKLNFAYFSDISYILFQNLSQLNHFCLNHQAVEKFLLTYFQQHCITEAYLVDSSGSLLLIDSQSTKTLLAIKSEHEMEAIKQLAQEQEAPSEIMEKLADNQQMLVFLSEKDYFIPVDAWHTLLHPCHKLECDPPFYTATFPYAS